MKRAKSLVWMVVSITLGIVLMGDQTVRSEETEQESDSMGTNSAAVSNTNAPPVNTLFASALPENIDPGSPLGQLIRLIQAGVDKDVILAYIRNSPRFFELDADGIIYLSDLGTPSEVIEAIMAHDNQLMEEGIGIGSEAPQPALETVDEQPPEVSTEYFYSSLAPYGSWIHVEGYGRCWRPTVVVYNSAWRPYCDNGHWVYTDHGWYWMSSYSWGWATFHYGRWFNHARYGWCWWPDTVWAPSWVHWRYNSSYCGWAPLPPYTACRSGVGLVYHGSAVSVGFDFNLGVGAYTFVSAKNFCDPNPQRHRMAHAEAEQIHRQTKSFNRLDLDPSRKRMVNKGIPPDTITSVTRQEIRPVPVRYNRSRQDGSYSVESMNRNDGTLVVRQPRSDHSPKKASPGKSPENPVENQQNRRSSEPSYSSVQGRNAAPVQSASPSNQRGSVTQVPQKRYNPSSLDSSKGTEKSRPVNTYEPPPSAHSKPSAPMTRNPNVQQKNPATPPPRPSVDKPSRPTPPPVQKNPAPNQGSVQVPQPDSNPPPVQPQVIRTPKARPEAPAPSQRAKKSGNTTRTAP